MKKTISILLIVMMVLSVGITGLLASAETVAPQAEGATTVNMSDITTAWADYTPKADDDASWEGWTAIGSYDDLVANFAKAVDGGKFYLTADIAIGSTHLPAANTVNKNFTFDGNGHSFTFTAGTSRSVFQMMSGATIQNLKLTGSFTSRSDNSRVDMAPLGSQTWGNNGGSIVLKNVYSDVAVTVTNIGQYKQAAGVISNVGDNSSFTDVVFAGSIETANPNSEEAKIEDVAGIVGTASNNISFTNCYVNAQIKVVNDTVNFGWSNKDNQAGGFVGLIGTGTTFTNCATEGTLTIDEVAYYNKGGNASDKGYYYTHVGGFAGRARAATFTNCINGMDIVVTGNGAVTSLGGFVGWGSAGTAGLTFDSCTNSGNITVEKGARVYNPSANKTGIGGFVGVPASSITVKGTSANNGDISVNVNSIYVKDGTEKTANAIVGGIVGNLYVTADIKATNNGTITASSAAAGGIVGNVTAGTPSIKLAGSSNTATITGSNAAGIIGNSEVALGTISNVSNSGNITGGNNAGGVVGFAKGGLEATTCTNTGNVTTAHNGGGIAGRVNGNATFIGCVNGDSSKTAENNNVVTSSGSANNDKTGQGTLGGLAGYVTGNATIKGSSNYGKVINPKGTACCTAKFVGGLLAKADGSVTVGGAAEADACFNHGIVESATWCDGNTQYVGGLVGYAVSGSFENCTNNGSVTLTQGHGTIGGAAGIVGVSKGVTIKNCVNNGTISTTASKWAVAGMVGRVFSGDVVVTDCVNNGTISGANYAGGMVGILDSGVTSLNVTGCVNTGAVSITGGYDNAAAGMVARAGSPVTIKNCRNEGTITTTFTGGGMAGYLTGAATIENCVNGVEGDATKGVINGGSGSYIGGMGGALDNVTIKDCINNAPINGNGALKIGGIVGQAGGSGAITDCTNNGDITESNVATYVGGIVGDLMGAKTVSGCTNTGDILATQAERWEWSYVAGIIGSAKVNCTINNCVNLGNVTAKSICAKTAGIIANVEGAITANITNCKNGSETVKPTISSVSSSWRTPVGGIISHVSSGAHVNVSGCINYGVVSISGEAGKSIHLGGIIGMIQGASATVDGCINNGDFGVNSTNAESSVAGIVGSTRDIGGKIVEIKNCKNYGDLSGGTRVGGIFGSSWSGDNPIGGADGAKLVVTKCTNYGKITTSSVGAGIVADFDGPFEISGCLNEDEVKAGTPGGILGWIYGGGTVTNCTNSGTIYSTGNDAGGIAGRTETTLVTFDTCTNTGSVSAGSRTGGIVGRGDVVTFKNCVNGAKDDSTKGAVTSRNNDDWGAAAGGILGYTQTKGAAITLTGCTNYGSVTAVNRAAGMLGYSRADQGSGSNAAISIENCTNNGEISGALYVGGMIAQAGAAENVTLKITIKNSTNSGDIIGNRSGESYVGGIVGAAKKQVTITGCTVTADATIKLTGDKGNKSTFIGGMIGRGWGGPQVSGSNMNGAIVVENVTNANEIYVGGFTAHNSNDGAKYENNTNGGSITISGSSYLNGVGGFVGRSNGSLSFNKCTNNANISITTSTFNFHNVDGWAQGVGGIIGNIGVTTTITNCTNTGNFTSSAPTAMGGIVGWATQGSLSVTGCSNSGNIENSGTHGSQWIYGGGIVGYAIVNTTISGCENTGNVTVKHFATSGGIMGAFKGAAKLKIENCTNRGACTAEHSGWCQPVGGIIGHIMTGSTNTAHVAEITGCKNYGAVTLTKQNGWGGIGGIVGMVQNGNAIISSCENHANLTGTFTAGEANVAGIVGLTRYQEGISCTLTVAGCKNFGNITGASNASGIIGQAKIEGGSTITLTVTDCTNSGTIISTGSNAGGVCANSNYTSATFSGCTNLGDISSKVYAGGIVGRSSAKVVINNCANGSAEALDANVITVLGSNSESYLGGIIAYAGGEANISNCVNYGKILNPAGTGFAKYVGGIAGGTASNATVVYNCGNKGTIVINGIHHNDHTQYVGGIVGYSVAGGRISYCYNDGAIQLNAKYADGKTTCGAAGAIVGVAGSGGKLVVDSCVNRSTITIAENITNNWAAGGVLGRTFSGCDVEIKNCVNDASAEINAILVGGIFGVADGGSKVAITNCQNRAPLTGNVVGGITSGDRGANAKITVDQCSNLGTIIGSTEGAGILAHVSSGTTATITNSVNVANVLGQARYGIAPETATVTECGFPMNLGLNGGSLIANVIGIGDKNSAMMSYYKDHLEDYINQMDAYLEEVYKLPAKYDPFTIEDLEQALEYAKSVFNTEVWVLAQDADTNEWYAVILTQARVNEAYNKLVDARAAVLYADQKIELLDRTIADAKELYNTSDIYTAESWAVFTDALHAAQNLRAFGYTNEDGSVTAIEDLDVEIIRAYIAALRDSIKNLVLGGNIYSAEDFAKLEGQKGTFYLMNDIEISAPVANFSGKLIGNGYTITLNKTALFENVDGELAIADDSQIKYASISDVNIVGNANGAESLFGKAYGFVKVSNVLIDVEDVTSAALFNENEDNAEISVLYVITYSNTTDAALVSNLNNGKVEMHYVLAMTDAVALVSGNGTALAKVTYLNGVVFYDEFGVSYTDADVFASGRVAYEMNNAMAASTNAKIASTTLVQILGVDELPAVGNFTADGLNKVIKEKGTYVNASYLYSDSEIPGGDVVAPLAPIVSGLNSAIARAEALIADNYTEASWANMLKALEAAKKAVTSAKTQVGVDNARKALDIAVASLVKKLVVDTDNETGAVAGPDYTALNAAIEAAQALKYSDFTSETWSNLQTMLTMAKIAKRSTSQATIDSAVAALNGAVAGLVKAPAETDKTPVVKPTEPATEDGCGSVVGGAAVILTAVIALGAGISFKKKED